MNRFVVIAFAVGAAFAAHAALGSPITYSFTQNGFTDANGDPGYISGTFVATPEADGTIQKADVSKFFAQFSETLSGAGGSGKMTGVNFGPLNDLFYDPANPSSLELSSGYASSGVVLCSGNNDVTAVFGQFSYLQSALSGITYTGAFEDLPAGLGPSFTQQAATVTALPPVGVAPDAPVPEPGTLAMFATGGALILAGCLRRVARTRDPGSSSAA